MLEAISDAMDSVFLWIGSIINSITGADRIGDLMELLPLFAIGIAISAVMLGIKMIRKVTWSA